MKVRVIRRFYDAKTKKPYTLRQRGEIYNPSKTRAQDLADSGFVEILEEEIEQPKGQPEVETKAKKKSKASKK